MKSNRNRILLGSCGLLALVGLLSIGRIYAGNGAKGQNLEALSQVEYGRHLVHNVAMCVDCHSPRGPDGQFIENQHLTGSPLPFAATVPMPWASVAPPLAGLPPHYDRAAMVRFLTSGERPGGLPPPLPPMPSIRMTEAEALAVSAYLESIRPGR